MKYICNLLLRMINVSLQTQEIVANLPNLDINNPQHPKAEE